MKDEVQEMTNDYRFSNAVKQMGSAGGWFADLNEKQRNRMQYDRVLTCTQKPITFCTKLPMKIRASAREVMGNE